MSLRIVIAAVTVPGTRGGAEILVDLLLRELKQRGHKAELLTLDFVDQRKEVLIEAIRDWRKIELTLNDADLVITTKFPSYFIQHPCKVLWLIHQHRQMYELIGTRFSDFRADEQSEALRRTVVRLEREALGQCRLRAGISSNVTSRLSRYLGLDSVSLPPPLPLGERYRRGCKGDYLLSVGRLCSIKRVDLMLKSMPMIHNTVRLKIAGVADEANYEEFLRNEVEKHHLGHRVDFLGRVSDEELLTLYADSLGVFYGPFDEDYGFVTLEALKSGKPVLTCTDSGGVLSFVEHERNGLVAEPTFDGVSKQANRLIEDEQLYSRLADRAGEGLVTATWDQIISTLLSPCSGKGSSAPESYA